MAILAISTDWGIEPRIVRIVTDDTLATITTAGYLTTQEENIEALQNGDFEWTSTDMVAISYAGGKGFFNVDFLVNFTFLALSVSSYGQTVITSAQLLTAYTTPILIVPAQGPHTWIVGNSPIAFEYHYGTVAYAGGGALGLEYGSGAHLANTAASSTEAAATINGFVANNGFTLLPAATGLMSNMVNLGIYLSNATGVFTTGDGSLTVNYSYNVYNTLA